MEEKAESSKLTQYEKQLSFPPLSLNEGIL